MKPVDQLVFDEGKGDCFRACVASLLELGVEEVPNFILERDMHKAAEQWLADRGLTVLAMCFPDDETMSRTFIDPPARYCIFTGVSPRKNEDGTTRYHAVVGRTAGYGIDVVHDPHPSRAGLAPGGFHWVRFIIPCSPSERRQSRPGE